VAREHQRFHDAFDVISLSQSAVFPHCHRKRGKSARASPSPHHTSLEERTARFIAQPFPALDSTLLVKPLVTSVPSYVKDTNDFLKKLNHIGPLPEGAILVPIDVVGLYPRIPHDEGLKLLGKP